jgi:hypothetical protein
MVVGAFTDQAYNPILLTNDDARMLRSEAGAPEHLLLGWIAMRARALPCELGIEDVEELVDARDACGATLSVARVHDEPSLCAS